MDKPLRSGRCQMEINYLTSSQKEREEADMTIKNTILLDAVRKIDYFRDEELEFVIEEFFTAERKVRSAFHEFSIEGWHYLGENVGRQIVEYLRHERGGDDDEREAKLFELGHLVHSYNCVGGEGCEELFVFFKREIPELPALLPVVPVEEYGAEEMLFSFLLGFLNTVPWINEINGENEEFFLWSEEGIAECWKSEFEVVSLPLGSNLQQRMKARDHLPRSRFQ